MSFRGPRAALLALLFTGTITAQTAPSISSLNPSSVPAGSGAFFLLVGGANFQTGAVVFWNGAALQTFLQSSALLSASVTPNLISTPGVATITVLNPGNLQSNSLSFQIAGVPLSISNSSLPSGAVGTTYTTSLSAAGGTPPYSWSATGTLPAGLALSQNGIITGIPTASGSYTVTVKVVDLQGGTVTKSFPLTITGLSISPSSPLPTGTVGQPYSVALTATGGTAPFSWVATAGLPPGLTINASTGLITGTPTTAGLFNFGVQVSDSKQLAARGYVLTINPAPLTITTVPPLFNGIVGTPYAQTFSASGGATPYVWSILSGDTGNLKLDPGSGTLQGTPQTAGTLTFTIQVADNAGARASSAFSLTITPPTLTIVTAAALPAGTVGVSYSQTFAVVGGTPPYTWSLNSDAIPGLTFDQNQATLTGTPSAPGNFTLVLQARDSGGLTTTRSFSLTINAATLTITTPTQLPESILGAQYSYQMTASGGVPPYTWTANGLPDGLSIDSNTGIIAGSVAAAGTFSFAVRVIDTARLSAVNQFRININLPSVPSVNISGLPAIVAPMQQYNLQIGLSAPFPVPLSGQAILNFSPDVGGGDGTIQFSTGGTTANFTILPGTTSASAPLAFQSGTVAGTISISLRLQAGGVDVTPTSATTVTAHLDQGPPVIQNATVSRSANSITIQITGYSTAREVTQAVVAFGAASGQTLQVSQITLPVDSLFGAWYQNAANNAYGSQFVFTQPFSIQGDAGAVLPQTVTLTNRKGTATFTLTP